MQLLHVVKKVWQKFECRRPRFEISVRGFLLQSGLQASRMLTTRLRTLQTRKTSTTIISITASFISFFCDEDSVALRLLERLQRTTAKKAIKSRVVAWIIQGCKKLLF